MTDADPKKLYTSLREDLNTLAQNLEKLRTDLDDHAAVVDVLLQRDASKIDSLTLEALALTNAVNGVCQALNNVNLKLMQSSTQSDFAQLLHEEHGRRPFQSFNQIRAEWAEIIGRPFSPINERWADLPLIEGLRLRWSQGDKA